jgi:hypothetical protein
MNFLKRVDGDRSMITEEIEESKFINKNINHNDNFG